jgi:MFS transporter, NNP family, nitrate/nitrite transporter
VGGLDGARRSRQHRILSMSALAFTVCFAGWTILSIIGVQIKPDQGLNDTEFGLLVATPILTGSLSRILLDILDRPVCGCLVYTLLMLAAAVATWLLSSAETYRMLLFAALGSALPAVRPTSASPTSLAGRTPPARAASWHAGSDPSGAAQLRQPQRAH